MSQGLGRQMEMFAEEVKRAVVCRLSRSGVNGRGSRQPEYVEWLAWASPLSSVGGFEEGWASRYQAKFSWLEVASRPVPRFIALGSGRIELGGEVKGGGL